MENSLILISVFYLIALVWIYVDLKKRQGKLGDWFSKGKGNYREVFESAIFTGVFSWGTLLLVGAVALAAGWEMETPTVPWTMGNVLMLLIISGLFAPVIEEIIFRGYLLEKLRTRFSAYQAVLFSSLLFAFFHLDNFFGAAMFGVVWCLLYLKYQSLWPAVLSHLLYSMSNVLFELSSSQDTAVSAPSPSVSSVLLMASLFIAIGLIWLIPFVKRNWKLIMDAKGR